VKRLGFVATAVVVALAIALPAFAALREVDVGNYYFEDVATGNRKVITVNQGDQIRFTVRQSTYPPHDVVIDGYGKDYESGQLLLLETFTTPPLNKPGTFALYCRAHRRRGHEAKLVVKSTAPSPTPSSSPKKKSTAKPAGSSSPRSTPTASTSAAPHAVAPSPGSSPSFAPAGVGVATDRRLASPDSNSLAGILGRDIGGGEPWTTAVWTWLLALIPIAALTGYAIRSEVRRR
jgi:plastocyanin